MNNELTHWGIKGQKWGRRRYQNPDGSLTAAGRERYGSTENFDKRYEKDIKREAEAMKVSRNQMADVNKSVQQINNAKQSKKEKKAKNELDEQIREKVYKMSDQELREAVNRMNMEERYTQVMKDRTHIEVGKTKTEKFLDLSSAALTATTSVLTIAILMKELQK